jgi:lipoate-protein ligase B
LSSAKTRSKVSVVRYENKWGRSNRRHFARQNSRKKTEQEKEWVEEYAPQFTTGKTYDNENKFVERIMMPNLFDMCKNNHTFPG